MPPVGFTIHAARRRPVLGALPLLVSLLLLALEMATPFAHAMLHLSASRHRQVHATRGHNDAVWAAVTETERPCPLCATDQLPALPGPPAAMAPLHTARAAQSTALLFTRSCAPLDLFCRPPPQL